MAGKKILFGLGLVVGITVLLWAGYSINREYRRNRQIQGQIDSLKSEADKLKRDNLDLGDRIAYFETPAFQEKIAKEKLNLQKENEQVVIIKPGQNVVISQPGDDAGTQPKTVAEQPNYRKWWEYFFGQ